MAKRLLTEEQEKFICLNVKGKGNEELTELVNKKFNLNLSRQQIKTWKNNHNVTSGLTGYFPKGHVPINKGTKGMFNVGGNKTSFKKGHQPTNYKPVGTERIDSKEGYIIIKVQDEGPWEKRWRQKHRVVWEKENGPIPKGHVLIFLDQDKTNCSLDNLRLITQNQNARLNQNHWRFDCPEATEASLNLVKLTEIKAKRKKEQK